MCLCVCREAIPDTAVVAAASSSLPLHKKAAFLCTVAQGEREQTQSLYSDGVVYLTEIFLNVYAQSQKRLNSVRFAPFIHSRNNILG